MCTYAGSTALWFVPGNCSQEEGLAAAQLRYGSALSYIVATAFYFRKHTLQTQKPPSAISQT